MTVAALVESLRSRGVIAADAPPFAHAGHDRPWFIALLQGAAGWLAGLFLLVFAAMIFEPKTTTAIFVVGLVLIVSALGLYFADRNAVFLDQLALALSIAGQFALAWAIMKDQKSAVLIAALLLAMQCAVFAVMPNKLARTLAALFASAAWIYLVRLWLRPGNGGVDDFFAEDGLHHAPLMGGASVPVGWIATWTPLVLATWWLVEREARWMARGAADFARPALTGMLLGVTFGGIVTEPLTLFALRDTELGIPFNLWSLFPLLSIGLALYASYAAFRVRNPALVGIAIAGALLHLSRFYYLYGTTLMWKAAIMLVVGAALLLGARLLRRRESA